MDKYFFTYEDIHRTAKDIADRVKESGYRLDIIVAIGSGGFIPARILRTFLGKPILAVGLAYYDDDDKPTELPRKVQWIEEAERKLAGKRILLVDEVDDSRTTLEYCIRELLRHKPLEIAVAVLHDKMKEKRGVIPPEVSRYFAGRTIEDKWIVYPWDALDIGAHVKAAGECA
jgi:hypoxanthine phosphoribosyltransferase